MVLSQLKRVGAGSHAPTLFFLFAALALGWTPLASAQDAEYLTEGRHHAKAMNLAGRKLVMRVNEAARSGDLARIRARAADGVRFGQDMLRSARQALEQVQRLSQVPGLSSEKRGLIDGVLFHLKEALHHGETAVLHARHATHSKSTRSGLSHIRESAKHARISALYALEGEALLYDM